MAILKTKSTIANPKNILTLTDGADLCCGDNARNDYTTAEFDSTANTVVSVNVTVPGGSAATVALDGGPYDWSDTANDAAIIADIGKVATDLGFEWFEGGIELLRGATDDDLTVRIKDSTLIFNWIGTTTTEENAFTETAAVP